MWVSRNKLEVDAFMSATATVSKSIPVLLWVSWYRSPPNEEVTQLPGTLFLFGDFVV